MSVADELEKLHQLLERGVLSQTEFDDAKSQLLSGRAGGQSGGSSNFLSGFNLTANRWATLLHLSMLLGYGIPFAGWVVPIVLWQFLKDDFPEIDRHGCAAANWMISFIAYGAGCAALSFAMIGVPLLALLLILSIVFPIIAAIKAGAGEFWPYPLSLSFFKPAESGDRWGE